MEDSGIDLIAKEPRDTAFGTDWYVLHVLRREATTRHYCAAHNFVKSANFLDADLPSFQVFAALDVALNEHGLGKFVRVSAEHFCARAFRRPNDRRIRACTGDIEAPGDTAAQCLCPAFEGDKLNFNIVLRKKPHIVGNIRWDVYNVGRCHRDAEDNLPLGLGVSRRGPKPK